MYTHFKANGILHSAQHGFCKDRSTCSNLLESFNDWTLSIQDKYNVAIAYIDFSMAFDSVSNEKLFVRLHAYFSGCANFSLLALTKLEWGFHCHLSYSY